MKNTLFLLILTAFLAVSAFAQQTIVNVPSADVLDKGKVYVEFDASYKFNSNTTNTVNKFSSFVPRVVVGIGSKIEVGMNLVGNIQPGADSTTVVPTIKAKVYDKESWAIVTGANVYIPVRNRAYNIGSYTYLQASKTLKSNTRLTFGAYHASKNVFASQAQRAGGQFGIEQTINSKFSVGADWITGKHAGGYVTPVFTYKPHPKVAIYQGYSIGNADANRGNHFFYTAIGINLN
ncbi:MAG: hypothetical protein AAB336_03770 [Acidobacteriota bacterium]